MVNPATTTHWWIDAPQVANSNFPVVHVASQYWSRFHSFRSFAFQPRMAVAVTDLRGTRTCLDCHCREGAVRGLFDRHRDLGGHCPYLVGGTAMEFRTDEVCPSCSPRHCRD